LLKTSLLLFTAAMFFPFGLQNGAASQAAPAAFRYVVKRAANPVLIDGHLDEPEWKAGEPIKLAAYNEGLSLKQETTAKLLWDDDYLYISFLCEDSNIWYSLVHRDEFLWVEEVVEVYLNPDGDRETYLELQVNPVGTLFDGYILKRDGRRDLLLAWNSQDLRRAVVVQGTLNDSSDTDRGWSVEMAVPLKDLPTGPNNPPKPGDKWRINLYRIDRPQQGKFDPFEYSAWSPVSGDSFHDPDRFAEIEFSASTLP